MKKTLLTLVITSFVLMGCGQTGRLYLPDDYGKCPSCDTNVGKDSQSDDK